MTVIVRESFKIEIEDLLKTKWAAYSDLNFNFICQYTTDLPGEFEGQSQREKPWGTAHILYILKKQIDTPFIIMNADDFYGREAITRLAQFLDEKPGQHALVSYLLQNTLSPHGAVTRGICEIKNSELVAIDEVSNIQPDDQRDAFVSMNLWAFSPQIFSHVEDLFKQFIAKNINDPKAEYQIPTMVNDMLKLGVVKVTSLPTESDWFGVTYQEDRSQVEDKIKKLTEQKVYPANLFAK